MPSANRKRLKRDRPSRLDRREQIARRGLAEAVPVPSGGAPSPSRRCSVKMSAAILMRPLAWNSSICLSPSPSMSKALREQKCFRPSTACAGQTSRPVQRRTTSASPVFSSISRNAAEPQAGQTFGELEGPSSLRPLSSTTPTTCGMTSPARWTSTVSPTRTSARYFVLVVQRRVGDDDAADGHRMQLRHRRQRPCAADLDLDRLHARRRPLGRELVRHRPARERETKPSRRCSARSSTL